MTKTTITAARAAEIFADKDSSTFPFRTLNQAGRAAVATWVKMYAKSAQNLDAWYSDAEQAANDAGSGESIIIEMRGMNTHSGTPKTLILTDECFDWAIHSA